ncbi:MAG: PAS domain S-box protein [Spirochaetota bacterium]
MQKSDRSKTVLLVDHDKITSRKTAEILEEHGYDTVLAENAREAMKALHRGPAIELVLTEIDLPGESDGIELARRIPTVRDVPIVFLTAGADIEAVRRLPRANRYGYVPKTVGAHVLPGTVETALELHQSERSNEYRRRYLEALFSAAPDAIVADDAQHRVTDWNPGAERLFGHTADEAIGRHIDELITPEEAPERAEALRWSEHTIAGNEIRDLEAVRYRKDGSPVDVLISVAPIVTGGEFVGSVAVYRDITERRRHEAELARSRNFAYAVLNAVPAPVFYKSAEGVYLGCNRAFTEMMGYRSEDLRGKTMAELWPDADVETYEACDRDVLENPRQQTYESVVKDKDGVMRPVIFGKNVYYDEERHAAGLVGSFLDISDRKQAEQDRERALEEREHLLRELNHRVKNNLAMVSSLLSLKQADLGDKADLSDIRGQIGAILNVHETLSHSSSYTHIDIRDYAQRVVEPVIGSSARMRGAQPVRFENEMPHLSIPTRMATTLGLILNELATNAVKHGLPYAEEPWFTIDFRQDAVDGAASGGYVMTVANAGPPLPPEIGLDNPTTLGLRLVSALVDQLHGTLEVSPERDPVFTIRFPAKE